MKGSKLYHLVLFTVLILLPLVAMAMPGGNCEVYY